MAKLNFIQAQQTKARGVVVGSLFPVAKINGYSFKWKGKAKDENGELVSISGRDLIQNLLEAGCFDTDSQGRTKGMLVMKNARKRAEKRDPEYIVYAYPEVKK